MKKLTMGVSAICLLLLSQVPGICEITLTENFNGYAEGTLIGQGANDGSSWTTNEKWTGSGGLDPNEWILGTPAPYYGFFGETTTGAAAYRPFPQSMSSFTGETNTISFNLVTLIPGDPGATFAGIVLGNDGNKGPTIFTTKGGTLEDPTLILNADSNGTTQQLYESPSLFLTIVISNVTFDSDASHTSYDITVNDDTTTYGLKFSEGCTSFNRFSVMSFGGIPGVGGQMNVSSINITGEAVPEPASVAFFGIGLIGLAGIALQKKRPAA